MKKFLILICAMTALVSFSKDNKNVLNGAENASLVELADLPTFTIKNTRTGHFRTYTYNEGEFSYDEWGVATFASFDFIDVQEIQSGLNKIEFLYEYRLAYTSDGVKYPYQLVWNNPQPDKELWVDGILVTSVPTFTLKNTRTGVFRTFACGADFRYNDLGEAWFTSSYRGLLWWNDEELMEVESGLNATGFTQYIFNYDRKALAWHNPQPDTELWVNGKLVEPLSGETPPVWLKSLDVAFRNNALDCGMGLSTAFFHYNEQGDIYLEWTPDTYDVRNVETSLQRIRVAFERHFIEGSYFRQIIIKPQPDIEFLPFFLSQ
ncbi:hypothetical protein Barb6XT_00499 [Bacteroidales bacterium Barb6XT]|nr:hypothetical protein Barb6XT_00499 [Bacteroidales bacterium Barb6XT]